MNTQREINFTGLNKSFSGKAVLQDISIAVRSGEATVLTGKNGTGKTTLMKILSGLLKPDSGYVDHGNGPVRWKQVRNTLFLEFMYMHQAPYMFNGTVLHNLEISLGSLSKRDQQRTMMEQALDWADLSAQKNTLARALSGGQQQRVALARAWLRQAPYLLLDEPTANMDSHACIRTLKLLQKLKESGTGMIICTHSTQVFRDLADRNLLLSGDKISDAPEMEFEGNVEPISRDKPRNNAVA
jgi:tungstate transport system ATP-binding protein